MGSWARWAAHTSKSSMVFVRPASPHMPCKGICPRNSRCWWKGIMSATAAHGLSGWPSDISALSICRKGCETARSTAEWAVAVPSCSRQRFVASRQTETQHASGFGMVHDRTAQHYSCCKEALICCRPSSGSAHPPGCHQSDRTSQGQMQACSMPQPSQTAKQAAKHHRQSNETPHLILVKSP